MIILFGDYEVAKRYFNYLNINKQFSTEVHLLEENDLGKLQNKQEIYKTVEKIFICQGSGSLASDLKNKLLMSGCPNNKICELNEHKIRLVYILYNLEFNTTNHNILSFLLCRYDLLLELYSGYLLNLYALEQKKVDIAFSFMSHNNYAHVVDLSKALENKYDTINYFHGEAQFNLKNSISIGVQSEMMASTQVEGLNNYKVLISPNTQSHPTAITVSTQHNMNFKPLGRFKLFQNFMDMNYSLIATKEAFANIKDILIEYQHLLEKEICLIPCGYSKLDKLKNDLKKEKRKKKTICYAPTLLVESHSRDFLNTLSFGEANNIIKILLDNFKEYEIVFRPHPKTKIYSGIECIENIVNNYKNNKRFSYDETDYYIETFSKTALLISDFSSTGQTFAFATNRPVLSLSKDSFDKQYMKVFKATDIRKKYGYVLNNTDELVDTVKYMLNNKKNIKKKIKKYRKEQMFNYGSSDKYFVDNFDYILNNKRHPDWFYIGLTTKKDS